MATHEAIAGVTSAFIAELAQALPGVQVLALGPESTAPEGQAVGVLFERLAVDATGRVMGKPGQGGVLLDLHYLILAWAADPLDEQRLLGRALQVLEARRVLTGAQLGPAFKPTDEVRVLMEEAPATDRDALWEAWPIARRPWIAVVARPVSIDPA